MMQSPYCSREPEVFVLEGKVGVKRALKRPFRKGSPILLVCPTPVNVITWLSTSSDQHSN